MTTKDHNPARYISRFLALRIVVKAAYNKEVDGRIVTVQGKDIRFDQGVFETSDPELIAYLEESKSFGTTYIRVPDNVKDVTKDRGEWMKDLETKERELAEREARLQERESKVKGSEEGAKVSVGGSSLPEVRVNMTKISLLRIAAEEGVEGLTTDNKNAEIVDAINANRLARESEQEDEEQGAY